MTVTFTTTYRETLAPETVAVIDRLVENSYDLEEMITFIDEHSEEDFRDYYEDYVEYGEKYGYEPVDCFITQVVDVDDIHKFDDAFVGEYSSPARMAEDFLGHEVDRLHHMIVVDWESTADFLLQHDIDRYGDFYFHSYF